MQKTGPKISVITAVYNGDRTLQRCFDSYRVQDYANKELVVIDGASSDRSVEIIRDNEALIDYWESKPDSGVYQAWNRALDHVTGDWVHFLGSDDVYYDAHVLHDVARWLASCPSHIDIVYGSVARLNSSGELIEMTGRPWKRAKQTFFKEMSVFHAGVFHRRRLFDIQGRFNESFRIAGDYEFLLRELRSGDALFMGDVVVSAATMGGLSSSPEKVVALRREDAKARRLNGIFPYTPGWCFSYFKAVSYYWLARLLGADCALKVRDCYRRTLLRR